MGGIKRTNCKWVMFVMLLIRGGREGKGLDLLGRGLRGRMGQVRSEEGIAQKIACFWKLTYPPWDFRNNLEISTESLYPAVSVSFSWTILVAWSQGDLLDWAWQGLCCQFAKGSSPFKDVLYVNDANSHTIVLGQATYLFNNRIMTGEIVVSDNAIGLAPVGGFCLLLLCSIFIIHIA